MGTRGPTLDDVQRKSALRTGGRVRHGRGGSLVVLGIDSKTDELNDPPHGQGSHRAEGLTPRSLDI